MGDERTYEKAVVLRAVSSTDGMTADWVHLPNEFLAEASNKIINKVRGINRVVYDISSKPSQQLNGNRIIKKLLIISLVFFYFFSNAQYLMTP